MKDERAKQKKKEKEKKGLEQKRQRVRVKEIAEDSEEIAKIRLEEV